MTSLVNRTVLPYVLWTIFDQIFTRHYRHVGEYGIKVWSDFVQPLSRTGIFKKWRFFGEKSINDPQKNVKISTFRKSGK